MKQNTRWWWVRHAPSAGLADRIYGQQDIAANLSDSRELFHELVRHLPTNPLVITSDLRRATETATELEAAGIKSQDTISEPAFREQHFGVFEGMPSKEFYKFWDSPSKSNWLAPAYRRPTRGESFCDVINRVAPAVRQHTLDHQGQDIIAIAHDGSIRAALSYTLKLSPDQALSFCFENLSLTRLDHITSRANSEIWRIVCVNCVFK